MKENILESTDNSTQARRPYETPKVTDLGTVAQLTRDPQVAPRDITGPVGADIFFLGDNA